MLSSHSCWTFQFADVFLRAMQETTPLFNTFEDVNSDRFLLEPCKAGFTTEMKILKMMFNL